MDEEEIWKSPSVPPSYAASKLNPASPDSPVGGESRTLRDVVELLKGASGSPLPEASSHLTNNQRCRSESLVRVDYITDAWYLEVAVVLGRHP